MLLFWGGGGEGGGGIKGTSKEKLWEHGNIGKFWKRTLERRETLSLLAQNNADNNNRASLLK